MLEKTLKEKIHNRRTEKIISILEESWGSYRGQYQSVLAITQKLIDKIEKDDYTQNGDCCELNLSENIPGIGNVEFKVKWYIRKYGDTIVRGRREKIKNGTVIYLVVYTGNIVEYNLSSTIAHELMHCFQERIPSIKGLNKTSALIYKKLLLFYNNAPSRLCELFFYGLYICYSIETSANISSVSNYISSYFKGKEKNSIMTKQLFNALLHFDKYEDYRIVLEELKGKTYENFSEQDTQYITSCMLGEFEDNGTYVKIFDKKHFDIRLFIDKNLANIVNTCEATLKKMHKNITNFFEQTED